MNVHGRHPKNVLITAATAACVVLAACSGGGDEIGTDDPIAPSTAPGPTTPAPEVPPPSTTSTSLPERVPDASRRAADVVTRAVDAFVESGSYAFDATTTIVVAGQPGEIDLQGWVDGADRELVMRSGDDEVITRVIDGVATVERDGVVTEVPLDETSDAPSIEILKAIQKPAFVSPTEVAGKLTASDLRASGFDLNGSADVTIDLTTGFGLAGYTMTASNGTWSVEVRFFDSVETRDRLVAFIAALEDVLADTRYEGQAFAEPELFIATGRLLCDELSAGTSPEDLITRYVEALTGGGIDSADDDDLVLAGALVGVSVGALCPEHTDSVGP